ncbi:MAG: hypothetical protein JWO06_2903, partial [Bacteroidota bacterium]|nr:hypothetical protein [Bacteroidota bacterium]
INALDMQKALLQLRANLQAILKNPLERNAMTGFDFVGWIDEQLKKRRGFTAAPVYGKH